ncbi:MAG TPA: EAL domain-containing protein [Turneriella sp.]|nr:EAL domain-containing protein [Turneriella sp.]HNM99758.1 EAL domain-containing protein [Turneriella sp.]
MPHGSRRIFSPGETIFSEGERQDIAFIIEQGEVEIWTTIEDEKRTLNILKAGALFGELALVDRQPRSASATALGETVLTVVTQQQVDERLADADPILRMVLFVVMRHFRSELQRARGHYGPYDRNRETPAPVENAQKRIDEAIELIKIEAELKSAMQNEEFRLMYQPIHELKTQKIAGLEALIRWKSPTRGEIMPSAFMPLAESTSLIVPIGNWVIDAGLADYLQFREAAKADITLSFNLARRQMEHGGFLPYLTERVDRHGIAPHAIKLEMLERNLFESDTVTGWIQDCVARGFSILLDDFGTGYSSLQYLQEYQPAALKIDRSFVKGLGQRVESDRICRAIIELAHALGIGVIAEGVETLQQARILTDMGCQQAQGYFFSPPLSADAIRQRLSA